MSRVCENGAIRFTQNCHVLNNQTRLQNKSPGGNLISSKKKRLIFIMLYSILINKMSVNFSKNFIFVSKMASQATIRGFEIGYTFS